MGVEPHTDMGCTAPPSSTKRTLSRRATGQPTTQHTRPHLWRLCRARSRPGPQQGHPLLVRSQAFGQRVGAARGRGQRALTSEGGAHKRLHIPVRNARDARVLRQAAVLVHC